MLTSATVSAADGVPLAVEAAGAGTPILIVPGSLAPPQLYDPLVAALSGRHRVVLLERRSYGAETPVRRAAPAS